MAMRDLADRIKASMVDEQVPLWFPDLTDDLAGLGWQKLAQTIGLMPIDYGTVRVMLGDRNAAREIVTHIQISPTTIDMADVSFVELVAESLLRQYEGSGVRFYSAEEIISTPILSCIKDAVAILNRIPSLQLTVASLVRSLHVIKPEDDDYDVSFSEPHIPFSVFVSVAEKRIRADALRAAEAIVHEAMHLQLTLIEEVVPLVAPSHSKYFSPWRREYRTAQGVLHALYVFRVIDNLLVELLSQNSFPEACYDFALERRAHIADQIHEVESFRDCSDLTLDGISFVNRLIG